MLTAQSPAWFVSSGIGQIAADEAVEQPTWDTPVAELDAARGATPADPDAIQAATVKLNMATSKAIIAVYAPSNLNRSAFLRSGY